ncbi:MAG: Hpt domain-containing protein [Gammaproteobacteria bacterium]|nr:Hpt domain-containing protein [Gammaproteobacteria bacterium]MDH5652720.1 Hpt domain-containing protein [Gammaproteobacteria bacterium]
MSDDSVDVQALLTNLARSYLAELPHRLDEIESVILASASAGQFPEQYANLYRMVHSLKGTAGTYGYHIITTICHNFEDSLSTVQGDYAQYQQKGNTYWLKYVDLLRTTLCALETEVTNFADIESELVRLTEFRSDNTTIICHGLIVTTSRLYENILSEVFAQTPVVFAYSRDGLEALGRLINEKFDFLVTDMEIPTLNGLALVNAFRMSNSHNKSLKTILLTSKMTSRLERFADPDKTIIKDNFFIDNIKTAVTEVLAELQQS